MVPSYISPSDFWNLTWSEFPLISQNIAQKSWQDKKTALEANRVLAHDVGCILAGKQWNPISSYLPPNPQLTKERSLKDVEMTLMQWANQD